MISEEDANPLNLLYYYNYKLVEHLLRNAGVGCSNHPGGTIYFIGVSRGLRYYVKV